MKRTFKSPAIHRTPLYRAYAAYYGMQARCENANGKNLAYAKVKLLMTLEEWLDWSIPEYEKFILENPDESPNVARNGDVGNYEIGNIRIISHTQNNKEQNHPAPIMQTWTCANCGIKFERRRQGERKYRFCGRRCIGLAIGRGRKAGK